MRKCGSSISNAGGRITGGETDLFGAAFCMNNDTSHKTIPTGSPISVLVRPEKTFRNRGVPEYSTVRGSLPDTTGNFDTEYLSGSDGAEIVKKKPGVILVFFGNIKQDIQDTLAESLERFFYNLREDLPVLPVISRRHLPLPQGIPAQNQQTVFFSALEQVTGNLRIGITDTGFYNPSLGRFLFSYGTVAGRGLLSSYRFSEETNSRLRFLERMGKQVIKTIALASTVDSCSDPGCVISYHRWTTDLDRNRYVCEPCLKEFARNLAFFLQVPDDTPGSSLLPEGE